MEFLEKQLISKVLDMNIEELTQLIISPQDSCIVAEERIYQAASIAPLISETLIGVPIRCYTPLEYSRYVAPYRDYDKMLILMDESEKITPQMKNLMDICRIMNIQTIVILFGRESVELKKIFTPKIMPLNLDIKEELSKTILTTTLIVRLLAETSIKKSGSERAKNILNEIKTIEPNRESEERLKYIFSKILNGSIMQIFSDHILLGVLNIAISEIAMKMQFKPIIHRIDDHPKITMKMKEKITRTAVFTSEVEEDIAKQICNYIRINGGEAEEYIEKGEPIIAPIQLSINLNRIINKIDK